MCPIVSAPNRGYSDWQRTQNMDTGVLFSVATGAARANDTMPLTDVSRFEYLGGYDNATDNLILVSMSWWDDAAGTVQVGSRQFVLSQNWNWPAQYRLPNLGPFVRISWDDIGGNLFRHPAVIFGTNRYHPLEFIPRLPLLRADNNAFVGAASDVAVFPDSAYAGPITAMLGSTGGATAFQAQAANTAGVAVNISPAITPAANVTAALSFVAPPGAWWVVVANPGAATNYFMSITPSMTGSS